MAKLMARIEGLILVLVGAGAGSFALSGNYRLLMNPTYRWLTASGAVAVLIMGLVALRMPRRRPSYSSLVVFAVLILLVVLGRPHDRDTSLLLPPVLPQDLETVVDGVEYTPIDLTELHDIVGRGEQDMSDQDFLVYGIALRVEDLEQEGQCALVRPLMACCVADAILVGFRMRISERFDIGEGESWVNAYGALRRTPAPMQSHSFRLGAIRFAMLDGQHVFVPVRITPFRGFKPRESIVERISGGRYEIFLRALGATGWLEKLTNEGPFTVFAPVDQAFDALPSDAFDALFANQDRLREFVEDHIVPEEFGTADLLERDALTAVSGRQLTVSIENGVFRVAGSRFLLKNTRANNGIVHTVYPLFLRSPDDEGNDPLPG